MWEGWEMKVTFLSEGVRWLRSELVHRMKPVTRLHCDTVKVQIRNKDEWWDPPRLEVVHFLNGVYSRREGGPRVPFCTSGLSVAWTSDLPSVRLVSRYRFRPDWVGCVSGCRSLGIITYGDPLTLNNTSG